MDGMSEDQLYTYTLEYADIANEGDPFNFYMVTWTDEPAMLCVIGIDADGNYGDLYTDLVTFPESGKSSDYEMFEEYYNALMGGYAPAFAKKANYVEKELPTVLSASDYAGKAEKAMVYSR